MVAVEIIVVGNEILLGVTEDTNSSYLCRVVRSRGGRVGHIAVVADRIEDIAAEIARSLERRANLIFTCGGLGPTDDDLTLRAVAQAGGVPLKLDSSARDFVEQRYRALTEQGQVQSAEMTEARLKMAHLPEGAQMIENPVGTAPAALLQVQDVKLISLPGVPAELHGIVEGPLEAVLDDLLGSGCYRERELTVQCNDESALATILREVAEQHQDVYVKSPARRFGSEVVFRVLLSTSTPTPDEAENNLDRASSDLARALNAAGLPTSER